MAAAERAVAANGDNPYAHYQVGAVASRQENFQRAAEAFGRSVELKPDLAYAHYYAGLAYQRVNRSRKCPSTSRPSCAWPLMRPSGLPWRQFCGRCEERRGDPRQKMCPIPRVPPAALELVGGAFGRERRSGNAEVDAKHREGRRETQADAVADRQVAERQVTARREHVAGIDERDALHPSRAPGIAARH